MTTAVSNDGAALRALMIALVGLLLVVPVQADDYYKSKRVNLLIGTAPGSSADFLGRIIARHLPQHLAGGGASVVPQNMPGGGGVPMMNHLYNVSERNGTAMGIVVGGIYMRHHFDQRGIRHKLEEMIPIFNPEGGGAVIYAGAHLGVKRPADLLKLTKPITFGFQSPEGNSALLGAAGFTMLGVPYKGISGYRGSHDLVLAVERRELDAGWQTPGAYHTTIKPKIAAGEMVPLFQSGLWRPETNTIVKDPTVPEVPTFGELYRQLKGTDPSGPLWEAWFMPLISYARYTIFFPPGVPKAAIDAMNAALAGMCADPQYQADVKRIEIDPRCYLKEEAKAITQRAATAPADAVNALQALLPPMK